MIMASIANIVTIANSAQIKPSSPSTRTLFPLQRVLTMASLKANATLATEEELAS